MFQLEKTATLENRLAFGNESIENVAMKDRIRIRVTRGPKER